MGSCRVNIVSIGIGLAWLGFSMQAFAQPGYVGTSPARVQLDSAFGQVTGPSGPNYEFGYLDTDTNKEWPVCGPGVAGKTSPRIPVSADGSYTVSSAATITYPNALDLHLTTGLRYVMSNSSPPVYAYRRSSPGNRCACLTDMMTPRTGQLPIYTAVTGRPGASDLLNSPSRRFYASTFEEISGAPPFNALYGPVAVTNKAVEDPRAFFLFHPGPSATDFSVCSCPNLNEKAVALDSSGDPLFGSVCVPMIDAGIPNSPNRVLAPYALYPAFYNQHILTTWKESSSSVGPLMPTINLPRSASQQDVTEGYDRRIWTCSAPYEPDLNTGNCVYKREKHACGVGATGIALSPYGEVSGTSTNVNFQKLANKKLACCLNSHKLDSNGATVQEFLKYDCPETKVLDASGKSLDFNTLWAGADDTLDGGQMNALALVSAVGQPITGFYTLRGTRCSKFSEFGGELRPKRVKPFLAASQQAAVAGSANEENIGNAYPLPSVEAYTEMRNQIGKEVPKTLQEMNECPILVRAVLVVTCPTSGASKPDLRLTDPTDTALVRCPMASNVSVHLRIEQLYHIAGQSPLKTFDTRAVKDQIASVEVSEIIANRYGDTCLPGTRRVGDVCVY
jgi:hypothetical protein